MTKEEPENLTYLKELIEAGELTVFIDRTYSFDKLIEAHKYVQSKRKKGNVIITLSNNGEKFQTS
jgi:NADPH:quinone reductase-like Zn-dependent oxidoreductase